MKRFCVCLKCGEEFSVRKIGKSKVDRGLGVCPQCGGRICRTDNKKLVPVIYALGKKNYPLLHTDAMVNLYDDANNNMTCDTFIFFHFAFEKGVTITAPEGYNLRDCGNIEDDIRDLHITQHDTNISAVDTKDVLSQKMQKLLEWVETLPTLERDPAEY